MDIQAIAKKYINMMPKSKSGLTMPTPKIVTVNALTTSGTGLPYGTARVWIRW